MSALSFDFGMKHIGVATLETRTHVTSGAGVIRAKNGVPDADQLEFFVNTWQPDAFIVGLPLNMDATESAMSKKARKFGKFLERRFSLPVHFVDERLSSYESKEQSKDGQPDHALAAVAIANTWLHEETIRRFR